MKMNVKPRKTVTRPCKRIFYGSLLFSLVSIFPTGGANAEDASAENLKLSNTKKTEANVVNVYKTFEFQAPQAAIQVRGRVISGEDESGIPGVTIRVKNTSMGTTTDLDGNYTIEVPSQESVLVFSSVGFISEEVTVGSQASINVTLMPDVEELSEVVVVGYGTQKRSELNSAIGSVGGEEIAERGTVNPLQGVQGQVAGVDISAGSGRAGGGFNIQIRGQSSLSGGSPLYVVDGVIVNDIDFLNPQDIEKIDILKDAASTAVYGSRGSNGVVQVTTKKGANIKGGTTISYDGYYGVRQQARQPDFMNGEEWMEYRQNTFITPLLRTGAPYDARVGLGASPSLVERIANRDFTYWPDFFLQTGNQQNHYLNVSGTSSNGMNYVIGLGYQEETGNLDKDWFNRYNFKASVNHKINDRWSAGASVNFSLSEMERGSPMAVTNAYRMAPVVPPYDSLGDPIFRPGQYDNLGYTGSVSPLFENWNSENNTRRIFGIGNIFLAYSPVKWLEVRSAFAPNINYRRQGEYWGAMTERGASSGLPSARRRDAENFSYNWDNTVTATKQMGDHNFSFTGLYSLYYTRNESSDIQANNLPYESLYHNLGTANKEDVTVASGFNQTSLVSFMGRLNYSYLDRYSFTLVNRWDGSSKLAEGHKWAAFPSASLGWTMSEENFLQGVDFLYHLKMRLSYGYSGNNNIDPYSTQALVRTNPSFYSLGGANALGFPPAGIVNSGLTWERTREVNLGFDYDLFQGRVSGTVDLYDKLSRSLLLERDLPIETGWGSVTDNVGTVSNKGIELSLRTVNIQTNDFRWTTTFNFARNKNAIVELLNGEEDLVGNRWFIGEPIRVNYSYIFDGIWQEDEAEQARIYNQLPGQARVKDLSGPNGVPDSAINNYDYAILGSPMPDWTGGFSTRVSYKGFDLSAALFTRQGVHVNSPFHGSSMLQFNDRGRAKLDVNYYMPANEVTRARASNEYPQPNNEGNFWNTVRPYRDASFVKVQNIQFGYTFSQSLLDRANMKGLRVYANILNPFVFTDYDGFDPEWASEGLESTGNASVTYQLGVSLKF